MKPESVTDTLLPAGAQMCINMDQYISCISILCLFLPLFKKNLNLFGSFSGRSVAGCSRCFGYYGCVPNHICLYLILNDLSA